jgi:hypothetical protein
VVTPPLEAARIFISCGQNKDTDEARIAATIKTKVQSLGFDPYVAVDVQTLQGLKESIFKQLENSEYFIFVDFKRDELAKNPPEYRGSLFSHQELALASYLDIDVLAFQEVGIKKNDGIVAFLQTNAYPFADRGMLPDFIAAKLQERRWHPDWRYALILKRDPQQFTDPLHVGLNKKTRYFNIMVRNRHRNIVARNCYVYLEKATKLEPRSEIPLKAVEVKWEAYMLPNANIPPNTVREFAAFFIIHEFPEKLNLANVWTDAPSYVFPKIEGKGLYELQYVVVSDNFPPARATFNLNLSSSLHLTTLE